MQLRSPHLILSIPLLAFGLGACNLDGKHCIGDCEQTGSDSDSEGGSDSAPNDVTTSATDAATDGSADSGPVTTTSPPEEDQLGTCDLVPTHLGGTCHNGTLEPGDICFSDATFGTSIPDGTNSSVLLPLRAIGTPDLMFGNESGLLGNMVLRAEPFNPKLGGFELFLDEPIVLVGAADFDGDGDTEVVGHTPAPNARLHVFFLNAENDLISWWDSVTIEDLTTLDVADWDGDGNLDIVATDSPIEGGSQVIVLRGDGLGGFDWTLGPGLTFAVPRHALGALDADGKSDDFVFDVGAQIFRHKDGEVQEDFLEFPPNFAIRDLAVADLDHDGRGDIVAIVDNTDFNSSEVIVALQADGFEYTRHAVACGAKVLEIVDFDVDGHLDLVVGGDEGAISIRRNDGAGGFPGLALGTMLFSPESLHVTDFDGDGAPDIVAIRESDMAITLSGI